MSELVNEMTTMLQVYVFFATLGFGYFALIWASNLAIDKVFKFVLWGMTFWGMFVLFRSVVVLAGQMQ